MQLGNTGENIILDYLLGNTATGFANVEIGLSPDSSFNEDSFTEVSGNGYARVAVSNNKTTWGNASGGALTKSIDFTFPTASGGDWGNVYVAMVFEPATNNLLCWANITGAPKNITDGDTFTLTSGGVSFTAD